VVDFLLSSNLDHFFAKGGGEVKNFSRREFLKHSAITVSVLGATVYLNPYEVFAEDPLKGVVWGG
jgi:hypothetical protein